MTLICTPIYVLDGTHVVLGRAIIRRKRVVDYQVFDTGDQTDQYRQYVDTFMRELILRKTGVRVDEQETILRFRRLAQN